MTTPEVDENAKPTVTEFKNNVEGPGLGFGEGNISRKSQLESGELILADEQKGLFYIQQEDSYVQVEVSDDGCGDGRVTIKITQVTADGVIEFTRSAYRAKVFGGGAVMSAAALIGLGNIETTADGQFDSALNILDKVGIKCGVHDDDHAKAPKCGCGAIDNYPSIIIATQQYRHEIKNTLEALLGDNFDDSAFETVMDRYMQTLEQNKDSYSGVTIKEKILKKGAVLKKLGGRHQEDFVVLNFIKGTTLNQFGLYEYTNNKAQAFSVDVWRLEEYAQKISDHYKGSYSEAFYSMLIYTLATSAVLTDGSQRVFIRQ